MVIRKPTEINIPGTGKIPISLEGGQLAIENSERLFNDSQNVSTPTQFALLEIGLEEIAKAWGIILSYEFNSIKENRNFLDAYIKKLHIDKNKIDNRIKEINSLEALFSENDINWFMMPFDTKTFSKHNEKIEFLSKFIKYIRTMLPIMSGTYDPVKRAREIIGRYISRDKLANIKDADKGVDDILNIDTNQIKDILEKKEQGLYLDVQNNVFISPSARIFETETLENLLDLLIGMAKSEMTVILATLKDTPKSVRKGKN